MQENLETVTTPELAKMWCDEYARTTGHDATVVRDDGDWVYIKTPSHAAQPWQRVHLMVAIHTLRARPDYGSSMFSAHAVTTCDASH